MPISNDFTPPVEAEEIRDILNRLCDDVANADEVYETASIKNFTIKVKKHVADLARHFGVNPFSYIALGQPDILKPRKDKLKRKNEISFEKSSGNNSPVSVAKKPRNDVPASSSKASLFKAKRIKCIVANCKVCLAPMDQRIFMPDGETFYCSTDCIHRKVKQVQKSLNSRDQIFVTDKRGRLHPNYVSDIESLESFLLRKPNYEPCVKTDESEQRPQISNIEDSRIRIRKAFSDQIMTRCLFHDIDITEKKSKELAYQVEYDLFEYIKSVKDPRYRNWCRGFLKFIINSGKVFFDKFVSGAAATSRLVRISDRILDSELHKMDEIEAAVDTTQESVTLPDISTPSTETPTNNNEIKPKPISTLSAFPHKFRSEPLKPEKSTPKIPEYKGRSAIDDILGGSKDTTSKHMSHLYDANCDICKRKSQMETAMMEKVKKTKQEREREREMKRNESREDLISDLSNKRENAPTAKKKSRFQPIKNSDDDISPGYADDNDYSEFVPPSQSSPLRSREFSNHASFAMPASSNGSWRKRRSSISPSSSRKRYSRSPLELSPNVSYLRSSFSSDNPRRVESWKKPDSRPRMTPEPIINNPLDDIIWSGSFTYPKMFAYDCDFSVVKNRKASLNLRNVLPSVIKVHGLVDCETVWNYLDNLRNAWTKEVVTLLMHPPNENNEYQDYVEFYHFLQSKNKMTAIDASQCNEIKDFYLFALPPFTSLHPACGVGEEDLSLPPNVQQCGNIMAIIVKSLTKRSETTPVIEVEKLPNKSTSSSAIKTLFSDIPIIDKSPIFEDKSNGVSFQREVPNPLDKLPVIGKSFAASEVIQPADMDISSDNEEGEISSPAAFLTPPPPPPIDISETFETFEIPPPPPSISPVMIQNHDFIPPIRMPGMLPVRIPRPSGSIRGRMIRPFRGMIRGVAPPRPLLARPPNLMSIPNQLNDSAPFMPMHVRGVPIRRAIPRHHPPVNGQMRGRMIRPPPNRGFPPRTFPPRPQISNQNNANLVPLGNRLPLSRMNQVDNT